MLEQPCFEDSVEFMTKLSGFMRALSNALANSSMDEEKDSELVREFLKKKDKMHRNALALHVLMTDDGFFQEC